MVFYIMWTWAYWHRPEGYLVYFEEDNYRSEELKLHALFPFCHVTPCVQETTSIFRSISLN